MTLDEYLAKLSKERRQKIASRAKELDELNIFKASCDIPLLSPEEAAAAVEEYRKLRRQVRVRINRDRMNEEMRELNEYPILMPLDKDKPYLSNGQPNPDLEAEILLFCTEKCRIYHMRKFLFIEDNCFWEVLHEGKHTCSYCKEEFDV